MKICFLGGGALRLLGVVDEILKRPAVFAQPHLSFVDPDLPRARTMAALARKMPSAGGNMPATDATDQLDAALDGADFVYCCIRVGGVTALERDKRIAASYGFHGHDDFGPSGVMLTARTAPVVLDTARRMEKLCPRAQLLIFTNPVSTLVDAVSRNTPVRSVGLCGGVYNFAWDFDALFDIGTPCPDLWYHGGGLNHVSWITPDASYRGRQVMDMVWEQWEDLPNRKNSARCGWERNAPLVKVDGVMPMNNGHQTHFFYHDDMAAALRKRFAETPPADLRSSRQDRAVDEAARLAGQDSISDFWDRDAFKGCAAGPFGNIGVHFMQASLEDSGAELMVTIPNRGHIKDLTDGGPVETPTRVFRSRLEPLGIDPVPAHRKGLCNAVLHHQRLVVDAVVHGDKAALLRALLSEPTITSADRALPMFEELWAAALEAGENATA